MASKLVNIYKESIDCSKMTYFSTVLNNGYTFPLIGLGTWRTPPKVTTTVVMDAIDIGYRHIDCAFVYGNEREVGLAIQSKINEGVVKREDLFITSKLWNTFHHPSLVRDACYKSIVNLGVKYLDAYLIHWPFGFSESDEIYPKDAEEKIVLSDVDYLDTWRAMEDLVKCGMVRSIGVSNFNEEQLSRLISHAAICPAIVQVECHPYLTQKSLIEFCNAHAITFTAYSPLGSAHSPYSKPGEYPVLRDPKIKEIAEAHNKKSAQVLIRYQIQRGNAVIPRSVDKVHMAENYSMADFELTDEEMDSIDQLDINGRFNTVEL